MSDIQTIIDQEYARLYTVLSTAKLEADMRGVPLVILLGEYHPDIQQGNLALALTTSIAHDLGINTMMMEIPQSDVDLIAQSPFQCNDYERGYKGWYDTNRPDAAAYADNGTRFTMNLEFDYDIGIQNGLAVVGGVYDSRFKISIDESNIQMLDRINEVNDDLVFVMGLAHTPVLNEGLLGQENPPVVVAINSTNIKRIEVELSPEELTIVNQTADPNSGLLQMPLDIDLSTYTHQMILDAATQARDHYHGTTTSPEVDPSLLGDLSTCDFFNFGERYQIKESLKGIALDSFSR